jgi:hypothetical protein
MRKTLTYMLVVAMAFLAVAETASADAVSENVTKLKEGIVETLATWIPFVVLFTLLGLAMASIGIHLFNKRT